MGLLGTRFSCLIFAFLLCASARKVLHTELHTVSRTDLVDDATFANINQIQTTHIDATLELDFDNKIIKGFAILTMVAQVDFLYDIILDVKGMDVSRVTLLDDRDLTFQVTQPNPELGDALKIFLADPMSKGKSVDVVVYFMTNQDQTASSWVEAANTPG